MAAVSSSGYDALVHAAAAFEDGSRRVFLVRGERPLRMLSGLVTANLLAVESDAAFPTLVLTPKGRVLADAVVLGVGEDVLLDVPEAAWSELEPHFRRYLPPRFAKLEATDLRTVRVRGPHATERERIGPLLASLDEPSYTSRDGSRWSAARFGGGFATRPPEGFDLYLPADEGHELDLPEVGGEAWEVFRIENGWPVFGRDVSVENLPQETGLVPERVSFTKGCYTGQEVLARIHYRGKVNRRLVGIRADEPPSAPAGEPRDAPLHPGDELVVDGRVVGTVTSTAWSPAHGWIGLGYARREIEAGAEVDVRPAARETDGPVRARISGLPFVER